jgi:hypothetical protein
MLSIAKGRGTRNTYFGSESGIHSNEQNAADYRLDHDLVPCHDGIGIRAGYEWWLFLDQFLGITERHSANGMLPRTLTSIEMIAGISTIGLFIRMMYTSARAGCLITRIMDS